MNSPEIKKFIREHAALFWYTPEDKKEEISASFLVETILNYGKLEDIKKLIDVMGIETVADIFFKATAEGRRSNYYKPVQNFFTIYFKRHASGNSHTETT